MRHGCTIKHYTLLFVQARFCCYDVHLLHLVAGG
jgi:hypothetical protein